MSERWDWLKNFVQFLQGQDMWFKGGVTLIVSALAAVTIYFLWQRPPAVVAKNPGAATSPPHDNSTTVAGDANGLVANQGASNSPATGSQHVTGAGSAAFTGNVTSSGQSGTGNVTAGVYFAAPVTEQQKAEQLRALIAELAEIREFPRKKAALDDPTWIELQALDPLPNRLMSVLNRFYRETIEAVPQVGGELYRYKKDYVQFTDHERDFERNTIKYIGTLSSLFPDDRQAVFKYFMLRTAGLTKDQLVASGEFIYEGATPNEAEPIVEKLTEKTDAGSIMKDQLELQKRLVQRAHKLVERLAP